MDERLRITPGLSSNEGSCNFCNRHQPDLAGRVPLHHVYTVRRETSGGASVRFCAGCLGDLTACIPDALRR